MALQALLDNYLFVGERIVARLIEQVPDIPVELCEHEGQVLAADKRASVLMVLYAGEVVAASEGGRAADGKSQQLAQRWLVILGLNDVSRQPKPQRQVKAGPTLSLVHKALAGWTPDGAVRPMRRAAATLKPTFTESKAVFPLGFEIPLTL